MKCSEFVGNLDRIGGHKLIEGGSKVACLQRVLIKLGLLKCQEQRWAVLTCHVVIIGQRAHRCELLNDRDHQSTLETVTLPTNGSLKTALCDS